jgi:DNA (cytosine-5)-methyltransferase 1
MNVGSLFTGIGGFDLGLERAGMRIVWQCEQDRFCRSVLAKHWPDVPCYPDVRALVADTGRSRRRQDLRGTHGDEIQDARRGTPQANVTIGSGEGGGAGEVLPVPVPPVDVLCGGFPCQDISLAGTGAGIRGERSGLWSEYARLVRELRPRYVIVENVAALLARGLDVVLADLAACGYDAEWDCLPASAFGAPHRRDRLWLVAYPHSEGEHGFAIDAEMGRPQEPMGDTYRVAREKNLTRDRRPGALDKPCPVVRAGRPSSARGEDAEDGWWSAEPDVGRMADGVPRRLDRLRSLGNALVPQIAEWLGRRILEWETATVREH